MNVSTRTDPHTGAGHEVSLDLDTGAFTATAYGHGHRRLAFQAWEPGGTTRDEAVAWARGVVARRCAACDVSPRDVTDHDEPEREPVMIFELAVPTDADARRCREAGEHLRSSRHREAECEAAR